MRASDCDCGRTVHRRVHSQHGYGSRRVLVSNQLNLFERHRELRVQLRRQGRRQARPHWGHLRQLRVECRKFRPKEETDQYRDAFVSLDVQMDPQMFANDPLYTAVRYNNENGCASHYAANASRYELLASLGSGGRGEHHHIYPCTSIPTRELPHGLPCPDMYSRVALTPHRRNSTPLQFSPNTWTDTWTLEHRGLHRRRFVRSSTCATRCPRIPTLLTIDRPRLAKTGDPDGVVSIQAKLKASGRSIDAAAAHNSVAEHHKAMAALVEQVS